MVIGRFSTWKWNKGVKPGFKFYTYHRPLHYIRIGRRAFIWQTGLKEE